MFKFYENESLKIQPQDKYAKTEKQLIGVSVEE